jgi:ADP-ribose pyrophosphatase YjhB (NUDIX family)
MLSDQLSLYLTLLGPPVCEEVVDWDRQVLRMRSYITHRPPPAEFVTSVRAVVLQRDQVLAVRNPREVHILPGGRMAAGERLEQTAVRTIRVETGWTVGNFRQIGVRSFHHLSPKPARYPYPFPDFLQLIYVADAVSYNEADKDPSGWEMSAEFVPFTSSTVSTLRISDRHFLMAARRSLVVV